MIFNIILSYYSFAIRSQLIGTRCSKNANRILFMDENGLRNHIHWACVRSRKYVFITNVSFNLLRLPFSNSLVPSSLSSVFNTSPFSLISPLYRISSGWRTYISRFQCSNVKISVRLRNGKRRNKLYRSWHGNRNIHIRYRLNYFSYATFSICSLKIFRL